MKKKNPSCVNMSNCGKRISALEHVASPLTQCKPRVTRAKRRTDEASVSGEARVLDAAFDQTQGHVNPIDSGEMHRGTRPR